jgi:Sulfotransferase family
MPIFRINDQLHYFAHVPKCGGSSLSKYLALRFGPIAFWDLARFRLPPEQRWSRTSPQHIPVATLDHMIPRDWLASSFAVVRHPVRRVVSAFHHARDRDGHLPPDTDFNDWFPKAAAGIVDDPYCFLGHFAPQTTFVPQGSHIFRIENGLEKVVAYLDQLAGNRNGPREVPAVNVSKWRGEGKPLHLADQTLALIHKVYAEDFARFGYDPAPQAAVAAVLPDLPVLASTGRPPMPRREGLVDRIVRSARHKAGL